MSITAADLYRQARAKIGVNFQDGRLDENNLDGAIAAVNGGLSEFSLRQDWEFLYDEGTFNTVAGTAAYDLPTDHIRTLWLAIEDRELRQEPRSSAVRFYDGRNTPAYFSILGGKIRLSPVPDEAKTVRHGYYRHLPPVESTSVSGFAAVEVEVPSYYVGVAVLYIAKHIALMLKDRDAYQLVTAELAGQLRVMEDNNMRSASPRSPKVRNDGI